MAAAAAGAEAGAGGPVRKRQRKEDQEVSFDPAAQDERIAAQGEQIQMLMKIVAQLVPAQLVPKQVPPPPE